MLQQDVELRQHRYRYPQAPGLSASVNSQERVDVTHFILTLLPGSLSMLPRIVGPHHDQYCYTEDSVM
jgi:hypothetical protein